MSAITSGRSQRRPARRLPDISLMLCVLAIVAVFVAAALGLGYLAGTLGL